MLVTLTVLSFLNYYLFHSVAEVFSCAISYSIFMFSINTYRITKNNFFVLLGFGYVCVAVLDMLHTFSFGKLSIFADKPFDADVKFWIVARGIEAGTFLLASMSLFKKDAKYNNYFIFFVYSIITVFFICDILYFRIVIPTLRISEGLTTFKIYLEYSVMFLFFICLINIYKAKQIIDNTIFTYFIVALVLKIISGLFFTLYVDIFDFFNFIGHLIKICSCYFIHVGIIENGINMPFNLLNNNLQEVDSKYHKEETHRKYLERIIIQNENCYDLIVENSSNCIVIISDEKILYANKTAIKTVKALDLSDIEGKSVWEFTDAKLLEEYKLKEIVDSCLFNEVDIIDFEGNKLKLEYALNNITYKGKQAFLVLLKNITHKEEIKLLKNNLFKSKEKLVESNELNKELTEFFSNISHELKTPLNIIIGSIQLILQNNKAILIEDFEKYNKLLKIMKQNAYRLVRLVNNLIDTSKCDAGYIKLNMHNYNIVSIVEEITLSVSEFFKMNGIKLIFDTDTEEKIMAVDGDMIERIILNLLSNSMKFTDKGGEVFVNLTDMGDFVTISVKDTGIGIPEDKIKHIFNRFEQVDRTYTRKREGSGIGLTLVKCLVEVHGGKIDVKSKINEGSEFIINLPVVIIENEETDNILTFENKVDKISIEFSDIYS